MMSGIVILAQLVGALLADAERERQQQVARGLVEFIRVQQQSPVTEFRLVNRSGQPIDAAGMTCSSKPKERMNFQEYTRREGPYGKEPTLLHRVSWPKPFVLGSVTRIRGKREAEYPLNFACEPGVRVLIVVDEKGEVTARQDR